MCPITAATLCPLQSPPGGACVASPGRSGRTQPGGASASASAGRGPQVEVLPGGHGLSLLLVLSLRFTCIHSAICSFAPVPARVRGPSGAEQVPAHPLEPPGIWGAGHFQATAQRREGGDSAGTGGGGDPDPGVSSGGRRPNSRPCLPGPHVQHVLKDPILRAVLSLAPPHRPRTPARQGLSPLKPAFTAALVTEAGGLHRRTHR